MGKFDGPKYLPGIFSAVKFLPGDEEEARSWAREHASPGWNIQCGSNDRVCTLVFNHKEGDTALFPFTYIWDGEKIVKKYVTQECSAHSCLFAANPLYFD